MLSNWKNSASADRARNTSNHRTNIGEEGGPRRPKLDWAPLCRTLRFIPTRPFIGGTQRWESIPLPPWQRRRGGFPPALYSACVHLAPSGFRESPTFCLLSISVELHVRFMIQALRQPASLETHGQNKKNIAVVCLVLWNSRKGNSLR